MIIEYIEKMGILPRELRNEATKGRLGCKICVMVSNNNTIKEIIAKLDSGVKIAVFAAGDLAGSLQVINAVGIQPTVLCNSDSAVYGNSVFGYRIISAWDVIKNRDNYYIIIPDGVNDSILKEMIYQMVYHGIEAFSYLKSVTFPDFDRIENGNVLRDAYFKIVNEGYKSSYLSKPVNFDGFIGINWWNRIFEWVYQEFKEKKEFLMLDIGPGHGFFSRLVSSLVDVRIDWVNIGEFIFNHDIIDNFYVLDIETEEIPTDKKYDVIIMTEVIEHFKFNPVPTMVKIKGSLREKGLFFLSCPPFRNLFIYRAWKDMPLPGKEIPKISYHDHIYQYSLDDLKNISGEAGFKIIKEDVSVFGNTNLMLCVSEKGKQ